MSTEEQTVTDTKMTAAKATALRKPFPKESVGQLPKGGVMLDFVGHAAVTDRLLTVDPEWSWEPMMYDPATGRPSVFHSTDPDGNLWINLTVCGVTRPGVGDGKSAKERIGDALRNAAMRFGVALDLWAKENLVEFEQAANPGPPGTRTTWAGTSTGSGPPAGIKSGPTITGDAADSPMTVKTRGRLFALFGDLKIEEEAQLPGINHICGTELTSRSQLTEGQARRVIKVLESKQKNTRQADAS